jgi:hypothetical protein
LRALHCVERNEESPAYFLLVPVIDGDQRPIGEVSSARFDWSGTTLPLRADVRLASLTPRAAHQRQPRSARKQTLNLIRKGGLKAFCGPCAYNLDKSSVAQFLDRSLKGRPYFPYARVNSAKR